MALRLFPRNEEFFDLFDESAKHIVETADAFQNLLREPGRFSENAIVVRDLEHQTDSVTHRTLELLYSRYLTPIDREDIHALITRMDDVVDYIHACSQRFVTFKIDSVPPDLAEQAQLLVLMAQRLQRCIALLRELRRTSVIKEQLIELGRIEDEGDVIFRRAIGELIANEKDIVKLIVRKELHEITEAALDKCASVGHVIEAIVLKNG